uniref:Uncharacterized protein n=1 Tax=Brassica oleracea var. oleracea TaxID=109376 RepID=A0A0D3C3R3_BRAOL
MLPVNLLPVASKMLIESGRIGISPSKQFLPIAKIFTDEFTETSTGPPKPVIELFVTITEIACKKRTHSGFIQKQDGPNNGPNEKY